LLTFLQPKQATLFSFMKKKDPNDELKAKSGMNFVTPAEKSGTEETKYNVNEKSEPNHKDESCYFEETDEAIERLVAHSSPPPLVSAPASEVVDLTCAAAAEAAPSALALPHTKRRKAPKKPPAKATTIKQTTALFAGASPTKADVSAAELVGIASPSAAPVDTPTASELSEAVAPIDAQSSEEIALATNAGAAVVTPATAPKKRARKATAKKIEAAESAALDSEAGAEAGTAEAGNESAADGEAAEVDAESSKPAAKRVRKTPAKPVPAAVVYPPHVEIKLQSNRDKMQSLLVELVALER
jgi:hypothetical protein